jgi:CRP/FNR family cyclic AMP-dependent transcriptional regulator
MPNGNGGGAPDSKNHLLDRLRRLSWLSQEQMSQIAEASRVLEVKRGATIYREDEIPDSIFVLLSGMATLWMPEAEPKVLVGVFGPGDIIGISALMANGARRFRCDALSECKVAALAAARFRSIVLDDPNSFEKGLQATFGRWETMLHRYAKFMSLSARGRLAMALLELAERFGVSNDRGRLLPFMVSHAMLAAMVGASRQHVTMQLVEFEREKFLMRESRRLVVIVEKMRLAIK